jgi:hypothetical protein
VCGACSQRDSKCTFPSLPGLTRTAALKSEVSQLKTDSNNLLELYRQLRDGSAVDAWHLLDRIRSGQIPIDAPPRPVVNKGGIHKVSSRPSRLVDALDIATSRPSRRFLQTTTTFPRGNSQTSQVSKWVSVSQRPPAKIDDKDTITKVHHTATEPKANESLPCQPFEPLQHADSVYSEEYSDASLKLSLQKNLHGIQEGFQVQQSCISEIFFCHSQETFESLISCLKPGHTAPPRSSVLCEICAAAIIAGQYVRDSLDTGVLDNWYSRSNSVRGLVIDSSPVDVS